MRPKMSPMELKSATQCIQSEIWTCPFDPSDNSVLKRTFDHAHSLVGGMQKALSVASFHWRSLTPARGGVDPVLNDPAPPDRTEL